MNTVSAFAAPLALALVFAGFGCACPCNANSAPEASPAHSSPSNQALASTASGSVVAVKTCASGTKPAADGLVDDLEDGNNRVAELAGRGGYWWSAKDDKGSTIEPSGDIAMFEGGANGSKYSVHVSGKTASADKAWGAVLGLRLAERPLYDASKYAGVSFLAKVGEKSESQVRLKVADVNTHPDGMVCKEACYNDFGKDFTFSHEWQEYQVSFAEMKQQDGWGDPRPPTITPSKLVQIAWHLSTPGAAFDLYLDDVHFTDCK